MSMSTGSGVPRSERDMDSRLAGTAGMLEGERHTALMHPSAARRIFVIYAGYTLMVRPLLSIMRLTGVFNASMLLQFVNVAVAVCLVVANRRVLLIRSHFQALLLLVVVQAAVVGIIAQPEIPWRDYLSHLAQLVIAFIMFGAGIIVGPQLSRRFWHRLAVLGACSGFVALLIVLAQHSAGNVARYELAAYAFLFVWARALAERHLGLALAAGALIMMSAKRGVMVAAVVALGAALIFAWQRTERRPSPARRTLRMFAAAGVVLMLLVLTSPAGQFLSPPERLEMALSLSRERIDFSRDQLAAPEADINLVSSGRLEEIETALETLDPLTALTGRGAGSQIEARGEGVQFLHFTPLSLVMVYGLPLALGLYGFISLQVVKTMRARHATTLMRTFAIYASAAMAYSLFAYSLFIDLLLFFSLGYLYMLNRDLEEP